MPFRTRWVEIKDKIQRASRAGLVPQTLEHIVGRSSIGVLPLRYFTHLLVIGLASVVALLGGFAHNAGSLAAISGQTTATLPSAFSSAKTGYADGLLVKPPDPVTMLVNRPRKGTITVTVAKGDTIASIADKYGISVDTILWANNLDQDSIINEGQVLKILPVSGVMHTVVAGETIDDIAWKYQSDVGAIVEFNQLTDPSHLVTGDVLVVPGGRQQERPRPELASRSSERPSSMASDVPQQAIQQPQPQVLKPSTYVVADGDTINSIAQKFGVSEATIVAANNLGDNPDLLSLGQKLTVLPVSGALHTVADGETIGAIATQYGVSTDDIVKANGLANADQVSVGRSLVIPGAKVATEQAQPAVAAPVVASVTHIVQPGESVREIAETFGVNPAKIIEANGIQDADVVSIGEKLTIPGGQAPAAAAAVAAPAAAAQPAPVKAAAPAAAHAPAAAAAPAPRPAPASVSAPAPAPAAPAKGGWNIVAIASKYLGYAYVWGGTSPSGFDCSGLVYYVYRVAGMPIPRDLWGQLQSGPRITQANLLPGDIVFFENTYTPGLSHDGIYIGGGRFINAASESEGVRVSSLSENYWAARYYGASRPW